MLMIEHGSNPRQHDKAPTQVGAKWSCSLKPVERIETGDIQQNQHAGGAVGALAALSSAATSMGQTSALAPAHTLWRHHQMLAKPRRAAPLPSPNGPRAVRMWFTDTATVA